MTKRTILIAAVLSVVIMGLLVAAPVDQADAANQDTSEGYLAGIPDFEAGFSLAVNEHEGFDILKNLAKTVPDGVFEGKEFEYLKAADSTYEGFIKLLFGDGSITMDTTTLANAVYSNTDHRLSTDLVFKADAVDSVGGTTNKLSCAFYAHMEMASTDGKIFDQFKIILDYYVDDGRSKVTMGLDLEEIVYGLTPADVELIGKEPVIKDVALNYVFKTDDGKSTVILGASTIEPEDLSDYVNKDGTAPAPTVPGDGTVEPAFDFVVFEDYTVRGALRVVEQMYNVYITEGEFNTMFGELKTNINSLLNNEKLKYYYKYADCHYNDKYGSILTGEIAKSARAPLFEFKVLDGVSFYKYGDDDTVWFNTVPGYEIPASVCGIPAKQYGTYYETNDYHLFVSDSEAYMSVYKDMNTFYVGSTVTYQDKTYTLTNVDFNECIIDNLTLNIGSGCQVDFYNCTVKNLTVLSVPKVTGDAAVENLTIKSDVGFTADLGTFDVTGNKTFTISGPVVITEMPKINGVVNDSVEIDGAFYVLGYANGYKATLVGFGKNATVNETITFNEIEYRVVFERNYNEDTVETIVLNHVPDKFRIWASNLSQITFNNTQPISLGSYSINAPKLTKAVFIGPVDQLAYGAFAGTPLLNTLEFHSDVDTIGRAFVSGELTNVTFKGNVGLYQYGIVADDEVSCKPLNLVFEKNLGILKSNSGNVASIHVKGDLGVLNRATGSQFVSLTVDGNIGNVSNWAFNSYNGPDLTLSAGHIDLLDWNSFGNSKITSITLTGTDAWGIEEAYPETFEVFGEPLKSDLKSKARFIHTAERVNEVHSVTDAHGVEVYYHVFTFEGKQAADICGVRGASGNYTLPDKLDNYDVVAFGVSFYLSFHEKGQVINKLTIPGSVKYIGPNAFDCLTAEIVENVSVPANSGFTVENISSCPTVFTGEKGNRAIMCVFKGNSTHYDIPDDVRSADLYMICETGFDSLYTGGVEDISPVHGIKNLVLGPGARDIGNLNENRFESFGVSVDNTQYVAVDGVLFGLESDFNYIGKWETTAMLQCYPSLKADADGKYVLPETVTVKGVDYRVSGVGPYSFTHSTLNEIVIPDYSAFYYDALFKLGTPTVPVNIHSPDGSICTDSNGIVYMGNGVIGVTKYTDELIIPDHVCDDPSKPVDSVGFSNVFEQPTYSFETLCRVVVDADTYLEFKEITLIDDGRDDSYSISLISSTLPGKTMVGELSLYPENVFMTVHCQNDIITISYDRPTNDYTFKHIRLSENGGYEEVKVLKNVSVSNDLREVAAAYPYADHIRLVIIPDSATDLTLYGEPVRQVVPVGTYSTNKGEVLDYRTSSVYNTVFESVQGGIKVTIVDDSTGQPLGFGYKLNGTVYENGSVFTVEQLFTPNQTDGTLSGLVIDKTMTIKLHDDKITTVTCFYGDPFEVGSVEKEGFQFDGIYLDPEYKTMIEKGTVVLGDMDVYLKYTQLFSFKLNGLLPGDVTLCQVIKEGNSPHYKPKDFDGKMVPAGTYIIKIGKEDGKQFYGTPLIKIGDVVVDGSFEIDKDTVMTVSGITPVTPTVEVTFVNGESVTKQTFNRVDCLVLPDVTPNEGDRFVGWTDGRYIIRAGQPLSNYCDKAPAMTLTATFAKMPAKVTVTLDVDANKGSFVQFEGLADGKVTVGEGALVQLPDVTPKSFYSFEGWYCDGVLVKDTAVKITKDTVFTAKFSSPQNKITYVVGEKTVHTETVNAGDAVPKFEYSPEGYYPAVWETQIPEFMPNSDVVIKGTAKLITITKIEMGTVPDKIFVGDSFSINLTVTPATAVLDNVIMDMVDGADSVDIQKVSGTEYKLTAKAAGPVKIHFKSEQDQNVFVTYAGDVQSVVLEKITVSGDYLKEYRVNDSFNPKGMTVTAAYNNGTTKDVTSEVTFSPDKFTKPGDILVDVIFGSEKVQVPVKVSDYMERISVGVNSPEFRFGYELTAKDFSVKGHMASGSSEDLTSFEIEPSVLDKVGENSVTVSYNDNGNILKETVKVGVKDYVTGITVSTTKDTYWSGEIVDLDKTTVTTVMASGADGTAVKNYTFTPAVFDKPGKVTVEVMYEGQKASFEVTVKAVEVVSIALSGTYKTDYQYGDTLSTEGLVVTATYNNGTTKAITAYEVDTKDLNAVGKKTVTVSFSGKTATFDVEVKDFVKGISVSTTKGTYELGESLDKTKTVVKTVMASGADGTVVENYAFDPARFETSGDVNVKVTYDGKEATLAVKVNPAFVKEIVVKTMPTKIVYRYGENFDKTGMVVEAVMSYGDNEPVMGYTVSVVKLEKLGKVPVTVSFSGKTVSFDVTVNNYVKSISIGDATKKVYELGEKPDIGSIVVNTVMADGTVGQPVIPTLESPHFFGTEGKQNVTVTYNNGTEVLTATFEVTVNPATVKEIVISAMPTKTVYRYGENFDKTGMVVEAVMSFGDNKPVSQYTVSVDELKTLGTVTVKVTYTEGEKQFSKEFDITVNNYVKTLEVLTQPTKTEYKFGDAFDSAGMTLKATMADGTVVQDPEFTVSPETFTQVVAEVTVTSGDASVKVPVTVTAPVVQSINVTKNPVLSYEVGDSFDATGMVVEAVMSYGPNKVVTDYTVDAPAFDKAGKFQVIVSYAGFETTVDVSVTKPYVPPAPVTLTRIEVTTLPSKVTYFVGEEFDPKGIVVKAFYSNGSSKTIADYELKAPVMNKPGDYKVTVSFDGKTAEFAVKAVSASVESVKVVTLPTKVQYQVGEHLDTAGMAVKAVYNDGKEKTLTPAEYEVSVPAFLKAGDYKVTVSFAGFSDTFDVKVDAVQDKEEIIPNEDGSKTEVKTEVDEDNDRLVINKTETTTGKGTTEVKTEQTVINKDGSGSSTTATTEKTGTDGSKTTSKETTVRDSDGNVTEKKEESQKVVGDKVEETSKNTVVSGDTTEETSSVVVKDKNGVQKSTETVKTVESKKDADGNVTQTVESQTVTEKDHSNGEVSQSTVTESTKVSSEDKVQETVSKVTTDKDNKKLASETVVKSQENLKDDLGNTVGKMETLSKETEDKDGKTEKESTVKVSSEDGNVKTEAQSKTTKDGKTEAESVTKLKAEAGSEVGAEAMEQAVKQSEKALSNLEAGTDVSKTVEVQLTGGTNASLSAEAVKKVSDHGAGLKITGTEGSIDTDSAVTENLAGKGSENVSMSMTANDKGALKENQKDIVGDNHFVDLNASVGEEPVHELGGNATVTFPYELREGQTPENIVVYYVDDNGELTPMEAVYVDGMIVMKTNHFSVFMVAEKADVPAEEDSGNIAVYAVGAVVLLLAIVAVAVVLKRRV